MYIVDKPFPNFTLKAYFPGREEDGEVRLEDFSGKWLVLLFYPADFTFVCPTELMDISHLHTELKNLNAEVVAVSTDTIYTHRAWLEAEQLLKGVLYPLATDHNGKFSQALGIYDEEEGMAQRALFIIDPSGVLRSVDIVSNAIGRSANEIIRKLKALEYVKNNPGKVCPVNWEEKGALEPSSIKVGEVYKEYT